jgi:hypothetical protein
LFVPLEFEHGTSCNVPAKLSNAREIESRSKVHRRRNEVNRIGR